MRRFRHAALAAALLAASGAARAALPYNDPKDEQAITAIETDIATQSSMKPLIGYFAPQAVILDFFSPGVYRGRAQIFDAFQKQLATVKTSRHQIQEINVASDGRFACAALEIKFDIVPVAAKPISVDLRQLDIYRRVGGRWQLVQQHISVPLDPKTGQMVVAGPLPVRGPIVWGSNPFPGPATNEVTAKGEIAHWAHDNANAPDIDALMPFFGADPDTLIYNETTPGELRGNAEIRTNYGPLMSSISGAKVTMPVLDIVSDGLLGAEIDTQDVALTMKDGSQRHIALRQSDCLRRVGDKWVSLFEMVSFALDPKTGGPAPPTAAP